MDHSDPEGFGDVPQELDAVLVLFRQRCDVLGEALKKLETAPAPDGIKQMSNDLAGALDLLLKESQKLDAKRTKLFGEAGRDFLDLAEARREIERRMASLRAG